MVLGFFGSLFQIVLIDLALSGDNAVAIALASHRLPPHQRRIAIFCGASAAIVLRILFTGVVTRVLNVPWVRCAGGIVLIWIAARLLFLEEEEGHRIQPAGSLAGAVWTIIVADLSMSLENMLAVGGAAAGDFRLLAFGLLLSIALIMAASAVIAQLMLRYPFLVTIGAGILATTAGEMIVQDRPVSAALAAIPQGRWIAWGIVGAVVLGVVSCPKWLGREPRKL